MKKLMIITALCALVAGFANAETVWKISDNIYHESHAGVYIQTHVHIYFGVWPVAYGHSAGAVYTDDGWNTVKWADAGWLANVNNNYGSQDENWQVQLQGNNGGGYSEITFEYALYVVDSSGNWYWDNNGGQNYSLTHYAYY